MTDCQSNLSDIEDDPPEPEMYQSSGEEWNSNEKEKSTRRRASHRLKKKARIPARVIVGDSSDSESNVKPKSRNGAKRQKVTKSKPMPGSKIICKDFLPGGFLVLKKDLQTGDNTKHPCLWRIDGKALLQKYEPVIDDATGKVRHRCTSVYTGWSVLDKDQYSPVSVDVIEHSQANMLVELHWDTLRIVFDSD